MDATAYLAILTDEIHSVVIATVDEKGLPTTRIIDIMLHDEHGLYFLTAKGKAFYHQLTEKPNLSLSGMTGGTGSMSKKSITLAGSVKNIGTARLGEIFAKNPYMATIYPTAENMTALEVFCLYKGQGYYFDLSTQPITRMNFAFGGSEIQQFGYQITDACNGCGLCIDKCPTHCISIGEPYVINQENCLHCGNCLAVCPEDAVVRP